MRSSIKARLAPCGENAEKKGKKKQIKGETNKQTNKKIIDQMNGQAGGNGKKFKLSDKNNRRGEKCCVQAKG